MANVMNATDVLHLHEALAAGGFGWCVVGGWGVDALLGEQSRAHKDLDVLLTVAASDGVLSILHGEGFRLDHVWEESLPMLAPLPLLGASPPSAFVLTDDRGREVDVHTMDVDGDRVTPLWRTKTPLTSSDLNAVGVIAAVKVCCMTAEKQLECHAGYELPAEQLRDVKLLRALRKSR